MFDNIGRKIKKLATVMCWIGIAASVIYGIVMLIIAIGVSSRMQASYATLGIIVIIAGSLVSWIGSFLLYGFGELIVRATSIDERLSALHNAQTHPPVVTPKPQQQKSVSRPVITRQPVIQEQTAIEHPVVVEPIKPVDRQYNEDEIQLLKTFLEEGTLTEEEYQNCLANMKK